MTLTEIVNECAERLHLTSPDALTRLARETNTVYRALLGQLGLDKAVRGIAAGDTEEGSRYVTFDDTQKLYSVFDENDRTLEELTFDELRNRPVFGSDQPRAYAISNILTRSVVIFLDSEPSSVFHLTADALILPSDLEDEDEPVLPVSFHDILGMKVRAIEWRRKQQLDNADHEEAEYLARLGELRLHYAKSAYLDLVVGKTQRTNTTRLLGT